MTLDEAIDQARAIQRDLDAGRLTVPYPEDVKLKVRECLAVFITSPDPRAVRVRLEVADAVERELPW